MLKREHQQAEKEEQAAPSTPQTSTKKPRDSLGSSLQDLRTPLKNVNVGGGLSASTSLDFISPRRPGEEDEERRRNRIEMVKKQQENREALKSPSAGASPRAELLSSSLKRSVSYDQAAFSSSPASITTNATNPAALTAQGSRSILTASKSRLSISSSKLSTSQPPLALTAEQMTKSFEEWMKMAADNKINSKNSWNFALIDYFSELTFLRDGDSINFQKASCTLDGCVKIYASRVDSVVDETTKLLNGLSDKSNKFKFDSDETEIQENDNEDGSNSIGGKPKANKLKKTSMRTVETVEKNPENLILKNFDLEFSIDPLFKKTSAEFDESGTKGALLKNLECSPIDNLVIFDSSDRISMDFGIPPDQSREDSEDGPIDISLLNSIFGSLIIDLDPEKTSLCPTFDDYNFNVVDIKGTLEKLSRISANIPPLEPVDVVEDENEVEIEIDVDLDVNEQLPFMADDDGFFEDQNHQNSSDRDLDETDQKQQLPQGKSVKWATTNEVTDETGLSYFDGAFKQTWAGPEHWKIRKSQRISSVSSNNSNNSGNAGNQTKSRRSSSKTEKVAIDFINSVIDFRQIFSKPTTAGQISLTKAAILERNEQDHLLPDDLHFSSNSLLKLFIKPNWKPAKKPEERFGRVTRSSSKQGTGNEPSGSGNFIEKDFWMSQESHRNGIYQEIQEDFDAETEGAADYEDDVTDYYTNDYDNTVDNNNGYNENADYSIKPENDENFFSNYENNEQQQNTKADNAAVDFNKNLVAEPKFTHVPQLNYARVAKRVDVAKLKSTLWNEFIENGSKGNQQQQTAPVNTKTFSNLINNLSKSYQSDALAEVSVPYCFICLLHLANEKNLDIQLNDKNDLIIRN